MRRARFARDLVLAIVDAMAMVLPFLLVFSAVGYWMYYPQ